MPRLEGVVAVSKPHALRQFSDAEWKSEERDRHLAEFSKDVRAAREAMVRFDPQAALPKSACLP